MTQQKTLRLTIAITTRNRADFIGQTLDSILPQITEETELLILDGASTDATPEVVAQYQRRLPALRYVRLTSNDGADRDFDRSVLNSRGEYCWLMTDDDLLLEGAVAAVLAALAAEPSLLIVNSEVRNADLTEVIEPSRLTFGSDRVYPPAELSRLFAETASYLSFIGCVVIRRSIWESRDRETYFGSWFVHMGVIFQQPLPAQAMVLAAPFISIRYGNAKWRPQQFELWMFKWPRFIWSFPLVSDEAKAAVVEREPWKNAARLLLYRAKGVYTRNEYAQWIGPRARSLWEKLRLASVLLIPGVLANLLAVMYCSIMPERAGFRLIDLRNSPYHFRQWRLRSRAT